MKFGWKHRKTPTPVRMKKFGDALFATFGMTGLSLGAPQMFIDHPNPAYVILAIASIGLGMVGKFLSTFFADGEIKVKYKDISQPPGDNGVDLM